MVVGYPEASKTVIGPTPLWLSSSAFHIVDTSCPSGLMTPIPVTTTRRRMNPKPSLKRSFSGQHVAQPLVGCRRQNQGIASRCLSQRLGGLQLRIEHMLWWFYSIPVGVDRNVEKTQDSQSSHQIFRWK